MINNILDNMTPGGQMVEQNLRLPGLCNLSGIALNYVIFLIHFVASLVILFSVCIIYIIIISNIVNHRTHLYNLPTFSLKSMPLPFHCSPEFLNCEYSINAVSKSTTGNQSQH